MNTITVQFLPLENSCVPFLPPQRMSAHAAGFDVSAALDEPITLATGARALVPTGFCMAMPNHIECQVRPRSGLALKHGITVLNAPGTIDADYRGEVKILLINLGDKEFRVEPNMRIAQLVFKTVIAPALNVVTRLESLDSERGSGGFGSTG